MCVYLLVGNKLGSEKTQILASSYLSLLTKSIKATFTGGSLRAYRLKARMLAAGLRHKTDLKKIQNAPAETAIHAALAQRLQLLGLLVWPYQCASWNTAKRLERFQAHYREIDELGAPINFPLEDKLVLTTLDDRHPGLRVVLFQPLWLMREGGMTIGLFIDNTLVFSLTFSLFRDSEGMRCALIGGCQGRNVDGIMDVYRDLTKALHGLRPRDFLMECFGILCRTIKVHEIYAVSDAERHRRHPFFNQTGDFPQDYDVAWQERGGVKTQDGLFVFPKEPHRKSLEEIKAKKRSLYRKRYAFLDELKNSISEEYPSLKPIKFKEL